MSHPLHEYCTTQNQKDAVDLVYVQGLSKSAAAREQGVDKSNFCSMLRAVEGRAAKSGYAPEHNHVHTAPVGYALKGTSTLYKDGVQALQWVKTEADKQAQFDAMVQRIELACEGISPWKPKTAPVSVEDSLLSLIVITDFHLGSYCWGQETGESYDTDMARDLFLDSIKRMIDNSPPSKVGLLCNLGDFLHWDGLETITPTGKNLLEGDSRYSRIVDIAMTVVDAAVTMMLEKYEKVVFVCAEGNHDLAGSIWLRKFISKLYADEPRLYVIDNDYPYYAYSHGKTMLCFHHGHKAKMGSLPKVFASDPRFREQWGQSNIAYIHSGHYHSEKVLEDAGAITEQHPTLASRDSYAARLGLVSGRGAKVITYDTEDGEISRITIRPKS